MNPTASLYFDKRKNRWTVVLMRGSTIENHRFHREEQARAFYSEFAGVTP